MTISPSDFDNWKADPVTKAFFTACYERVEDAKEILSTTAGTDQVTDNYLRGFIQAYREIPQFRMDDLEGTDA